MYCLNLLLYVSRIFRLLCPLKYAKPKYYTNEYRSDSAIVPLIKPIVIEPTSIISWNINCIPLFISTKKVNEIIDTINNYMDADILCLQECFDDKIIRKIIKETKAKYWYHQTGNLQKPCVIGDSCGLLILSKIPIKFINFIAFNKRGGIEYLANKGLMICNIGNVNIVNTHLQSGDCNLSCSKINSIINAQIRQLKQCTISNSTVFCGDFNTENLDKLFDISLNNKISTVNEKYYNKNMCLDYIFTKDKTIEIDSNVIDLLENPSDHKPILANIRIKHN